MQTVDAFAPFALMQASALRVLLQIARRLLTVELLEWSLRGTQLAAVGAQLRAHAWTWARNLCVAYQLPRGTVDALDAIVAKSARVRSAAVTDGRARFDACPRGLVWVTREEWLDADLVDAMPTHCDDTDSLLSADPCYAEVCDERREAAIADQEERSAALASDAAIREVA